MAGMAKRGTHSARHRAGRDRPGALGAALADTGLADAGLAETGLNSTGHDVGSIGVEVAGHTAVPAGLASRPQAPRPRAPAHPWNGHAKNVAVRAAAIAGAVAVVVVAGLVGTPPSGNTVAGSVKTFLLDWETGNYAGAAALTTGRPAVVAGELAAVPRQLGADDLTLGLGPLPQNLDKVQPIIVRGNRAFVYFNATLNLGRGGLSWQYQGYFTMRRSDGGWRVVWSPSVIVPGLGSGDRLAVLTRMPARAGLLDSVGHSLIPASTVVELGVIPADLRHPAQTADDLASAVGLPQADAQEMLGQIEAWPPRSFLELVQLSPVGYAPLAAKLRRVPDLTRHYVPRRLFASTVPLVTGQVGTETAGPLIASGQPYRPGATVGLSGLQKAYQTQLAGTPTTQIVVQNAAGRIVRVLREWRGQRGSPVRTTIDGTVQSAAARALAGQGVSAAIVATRAGTGQILAVAGHSLPGMPAVAPLTGQYQPAQAFTIVSTEALLASGFTARSVPCRRTNLVGGRTFTNDPAEHLRPQPSFASDFAHACATAFAGLSYRLTDPSELIRAARQFGIGARWQLPLPGTFGGQLTYPASPGEQAADVVGGGTVRVSPLDMALIAGAADSGRWSPPSLLAAGHPDGPVGGRLAFNPNVMTQLRSLMLGTVRSGAARAARLPGAPLYGQVGSAPLGGHARLRAIWFVGFRSGIAFAVVAFSRSSSFDPAVLIARLFARQLRPGS